ncbi:hypothetical protein BGX34_009997 [Mortierella sp. NVP85]|nr:hypothetical protein BGX34_009997 [Mortierella sp. NVP85]
MAKYATDLPELRQHIARHLDLVTLKACSLVCRAWHLDFHSVLWERFSYKVPRSCTESLEKRAAWLDITSKKAHLFRHIYHGEYRRAIDPGVRDILLDRCHGLITIEVFVAGIRVWDPVRYWEETLRPLIEQNKATTTTPPRLKHLGIHGTCYDGTFGDILSHLAIHSLESLLVNDIIDDQLSIQAPPTLRDTLSRLTELDIKGLRSNHVSAFLVLLGATPPHQLRKVRLGAMDTECAAMLIQQQYQSLESLVVNFLWDHIGALADILATCSKLKHLDFEPFVDIRTLVDSQRPWVCTELEVFEGYFGLSPYENDDARRSRHKDEEDEKVNVSDPVTLDQVESLFMQRLGQLTKLRRLVQDYDSLGYLFDNDMGSDTMAWTLSSGLTHLANLVNLQWLEFVDRNLPTGIGIPELLFMKQHWHSVQGLACYKLDVAEVEEWLAAEWPQLKVKMRRTIE